MLFMCGGGMYEMAKKKKRYKIHIIVYVKQW